MDITEYIERKKALESFVTQNGSQIVKDYVKKFMAENPEICVVRWAQYTPYFNDGEACVFSVCEPHFLLRPASETDMTASVWDGGDWMQPGWRSPDSRDLAMRELTNNFTSTLSDLLESVFGDHIEVFITRNGDDVMVETREFAHD